MDIPRITPAQVRERLARGEHVAFLDARSAKAYGAATEQLPRSVRVPPDEVDRRVAGLRRDATLVAYCT
jgi:hypothetical protein